MKRLTIAVFGIAALLLVACSSGDSSKSAVSDPVDTGQEVSTADEAAVAEPVQDAVEAPAQTADEPAESQPPLGGEFAPFDLLTAGAFDGQLEGADFGFGFESQDVDPALEAILLHEEDLPSNFEGAMVGGFSFALPGEGGNFGMAMSVFGENGLEFEQPGAMVMSMAMQTPEPISPDDFMSDIEGFEGLDGLDAEAIESAMAEMGLDTGIRDVRVLGVSGLGEGGFGLHAVADLEALVELYGPELPADIPFDEMTFDMYVFVRGTNMMMLMVMAPVGAPAAVDAWDLAKTMDERAQVAF
jgi:hypothetical protein